MLIYIFSDGKTDIIVGADTPAEATQKLEKALEKLGVGHLAHAFQNKTRFNPETSAITISGESRAIDLVSLQSIKLQKGAQDFKD